MTMTIQTVAKNCKSGSNGCIPCKARKKKCDGRKPTCVGCERNVLLCRWTGAGASQSEQPESQVRGRSPAEHAIRTPNPRDARNVQSPTRKGSPLTTPSQLRPSHLGSPNITHPISRILYQHYFHRTANSISALRGPHNTFLTELPKLAVRYPDMVLPALLALSGVHYGNMYGTPDVKEIAWSHLAQALRALKYALTRLGGLEDDRDEDEALGMLVTTLVLSFVETCRGDTEGNYQHHLRAARPLLEIVISSRRYETEDPTISFVKELYAYLTCINDLTVEPTRLASISHGQDFGSLISSRSQGVLLGCAHELFELVSLMVGVCRKEKLTILSEQRMEMVEHLAELDEGYSALYCRVAAWKAPEDSTADFANCGRIYQGALLLCSDPSAALKFDLQEAELHIETAMALLAVVPEAAPVNVTLSWPLAIFGSITDNVVHRQQIRQRLRQMYTNLGLGNLPTIIEFLDRLWADKRRGTKPQASEPYRAISLERLMQKHDMNISFM